VQLEFWLEGNPLGPPRSTGDVSVEDKPEELLLAAVAVGDVTALSVLVRRHQRRVYGVALSVVGDAWLADEVAQEAFLRLWRYAATYDPRRGTVLPWLLTITRNVGLDVVRTQGRQVLLDPADLARLGSVEESDRGPEASAGRSDDAARVRRALAALPAELRRPLVLASWHGATAAQISKIEGIPLGTAKTRLRTGLRRLRHEFEREHQP